ncbi:hypothetical protein BDZ45DRAFT_684248 [Acephala macrosclerotiorum]|nr:hypothetical protein BDZ45DRAFT_684248 [Acephala macrosclerotiorum]
MGAAVSASQKLRTCSTQGSERRSSKTDDCQHLRGGDLSRQNRILPNPARCLPHPRAYLPNGGAGAGNDVFQAPAACLDGRLLVCTPICSSLTTLPGQPIHIPESVAKSSPRKSGRVWTALGCDRFLQFASRDWAERTSGCLDLEVVRFQKPKSSGTCQRTEPGCSQKSRGTQAHNMCAVPACEHAKATFEEAQLTPIRICNTAAIVSCVRRAQKFVPKVQKRAVIQEPDLEAEVTMRARLPMSENGRETDADF